MTNSLTIAMAQINVKVGDIHGNTEKIIRACQQAEKDFNAQLIVFPELALTGYPPEDLLLRPDFHRQIERPMQEVAVYSQRIDLLLG